MSIKHALSYRKYYEVNQMDDGHNFQIINPLLSFKVEWNDHTPIGYMKLFREG